MEIKGKVIAKPASESGSSSRGFWKKAFLVVRYEEGQYPKDIMISSMRKAEELEKVQVGQRGVFKIDARTRQSSNGRWYCELECWGYTLDADSPASPGVGNDPF